MSQGSWGGGGGGGGGGWGGGGYGPPPAGGWGPPPQGGGGGGYGPPQGGGGGGGYGPPPGGGGGGYGPPPGGGGGYGPPGGGYGQGPSGFAPQPAGFPPGYSPPGGSGRGVPWEDSSLGFFSRWWGTVREALFNPRPFFASAAQSDDPWPAVTFSMLTSGAAGLIVGVLLGLMYLAFGSILAAMLGSLGGTGSGSGSPPAAAIVGIMGIFGIGVAIMYPLMFAFFGLVAPFVSGGIYHVTLSMFGGATKSYMHSVRVVGYSHASYFWMMIPVPGLNSLAAGVFSLICLTVGLDETHKCGVGKALLAIFLVPALCCLCWCGLQGSLAAIGASAAP